MHVHGFTRPMLAKLVRAGLATVQSETGKAIAVGRITITDAGRRWLEDAAKSELRGPDRFKDFWRE
jgi:DNA-binding PadR family transcriptional regulator